MIAHLFMINKYSGVFMEALVYIGGYYYTFLIINILKSSITQNGIAKTQTNKFVILHKKIILKLIHNILIYN